MKKIKILKVSDFYLDGGSRDEIVTNVGIFSLRQKIQNLENKNGFYENGTHVGRDLNEALKKALDKYLENKNNDYVLKQVEYFNKNYEKYGYKLVKIRNTQLK